MGTIEAVKRLTRSKDRSGCSFVLVFVIIFHFHLLQMKNSQKNIQRSKNNDLEENFTHPAQNGNRTRTPNLCLRRAMPYPLGHKTAVFQIIHYFIGIYKAIIVLQNSYNGKASAMKSKTLRLPSPSHLHISSSDKAIINLLHISCGTRFK